MSDAYSIRWVAVDTPEDPVRALTFWAGPRGDRVLNGLSLESVAHVLARACGHIGSCAEYLYHAVRHLEEKGIRDRNLWKLLELVAAEIEALHQDIPNIAHNRSVL
jgi:cation transport protein ChaC